MNNNNSIEAYKCKVIETFNYFMCHPVSFSLSIL